MTNRKVEATFHPAALAIQEHYETSLASARQIKRVFESPELRIKLRRMERAFYNLAWTLRNGKLTADERLALRWVTRHRIEGRMDLVEEDLLWLGKRLEAKHEG